MESYSYRLQPDLMSFWLLTEKHWFDEEKTKQIFSKELEATGTIPQTIHYTAITFL